MHMSDDVENMHQSQFLVRLAYYIIIEDNDLTAEERRSAMSCMEYVGIQLTINYTNPNRSVYVQITDYPTNSTLYKYYLFTE